MHFIGTAITDVGISKKSNQDSVCVKIAETKKYGQVAMVVLCDGMGGLEKGELASATVIKAFSNWFENELPGQINKLSWKQLSSDLEKTCQRAKLHNRSVRKQIRRVIRYDLNGYACYRLKIFDYSCWGFKSLLNF